MRIMKVFLLAAIAACSLLPALSASASVLDARWQFRLLPGDGQQAAHPQMTQCGMPAYRAACIPICWRTG